MPGSFNSEITPHHPEGTGAYYLHFIDKENGDGVGGACNLQSRMRRGAGLHAWSRLPATLPHSAAQAGAVPESCGVIPGTAGS